MPRPDRPTVLLIAAIAMSVLAYFDYRGRQPGRELLTPVDPAGGAGGQAARSTVAQQGRHPLASLRLGDLGDTIARPLFEPSRRPTSTPVIAPQPVPSALPASVTDATTFRLIGTILGEGRATAVVIAQGRQQVVRVEEGDSVEAWTVEKISLDEVTLVKGGKRQLLRMARKSP